MQASDLIRQLVKHRSRGSDAFTCFFCAATVPNKKCVWESLLGIGVILFEIVLRSRRIARQLPKHPKTDFKEISSNKETHLLTNRNSQCMLGFVGFCCLPVLFFCM